MSTLTKQTDPLQKALELVFSGRVARQGGYCEIPTSLFFEKVDVSMPDLPAIAFYEFEGPPGQGEARQIKSPTQQYSPLALSLRNSVWVKEDDFRSLRAFAESVLIGRPLPGSDPAAAAAPSPIPAEKRMETLRRSAMLVVEDLFENPSRENIQRSVKTVGSFVYVIMKDPKAYLLLAKLSSHDPYTLQHSVGTAVNCIILARKTGIHNEQELTEVGMAGLLHDIGKVKVKKEIINKNGPLDEIEWEEMRAHASEGFEIIKDQPDLSERTKRAVLEHHEDKHGTGYPHGKKLPEVDIFSRIVGLCDVYNALTTDRTYSKARTPFEAFQFMREKLMHKIDDELFKQLVGVYGGKLD